MFPKPGYPLFFSFSVDTCDHVRHHVGRGPALGFTRSEWSQKHMKAALAFKAKVIVVNIIGYLATPVVSVAR